MKKIFTLIALCASSVMAMATDYTAQLEVTVNGTSTVQEATISVAKQDDGKYTLQLNNFILSMPGQTMPVGNIVLKDVEGTVAEGLTTIKSVQDILIEAGNIPGIDVWMGPMLGSVPVDMTAEIRGENLYTIINIDMAALGQTIKVVFGDGGYQIGNSGFEDFHTATVYYPEDPETFSTSDEPNHWHSFMSASGNPALVYLAGYTPHTFISDVVRPGTTGTKSVLITSTDMWIAIANGTITTGRLNTGDMDATNLANHSWSAVDSVGVDDNGAPFYATINGRPDSLALWVKFKQGTPQEEYPYATVKAVLTDGSYYQDPEDKEYTNVVAKAVNNTIESNGFVWQRISIPFLYMADANNGVAYPYDPKVIHVTISTNAEPGKGSIDSLYVDDIELIYNCDLTHVSVNGQVVAGFDKDVTEYNITANGDITADKISYYGSRGIKVAKAITKTDNGYTVKLIATSCDLKKSKTYTLNITTGTTGISSATNNGEKKVEAVYNLNGQRVNGKAGGKIQITKYTDGKTVKTIKK